MDTSSSCTACPPSSASLLKLTSTARKLPSGLKAALATDLPSGSSAVTCRPVARFSTSTRQRAAHGGAQAIWVVLAAITASKGAAGLRSGWIPQLVGHRSRPRGHWCQQQAAVGRLLDQVSGRKPERRPERHAGDADLPRRACGSARISVRGIAGQPQRASGAWRDRVRQPHRAHRLRAIGQEVDSTPRSCALAAAGLDTRIGLDRPAVRGTDELVARPLWWQATDRHHLAGARPEPRWPRPGNWQPKTAGPGQGRPRDPVRYRRQPRRGLRRVRSRHRRGHGGSRPGRPRR